MDSVKGRLLVATPLLGDPNFERTVIFVLEHTDEGALGVVLNRPTVLAVHDPLPDWAQLAADPPVVFLGGPVAKGAVIGLARRSGDHEELPGGAWDQVLGPIGVIDLALDPGHLGAVDAVRVFTGYAGWGPDQIEGEIEEYSWFVVDAEAGDIMTNDPDGLWRAVLARQPAAPLRRFALYPPDLSVN